MYKRPRSSTAVWALILIHSQGKFTRELVSFSLSHHFDLQNGELFFSFLLNNISCLTFCLVVPQWSCEKSNQDGQTHYSSRYTSLIWCYLFTNLDFRICISSSITLCSPNFSGICLLMCHLGKQQYLTYLNYPTYWHFSLVVST